MSNTTLKDYTREELEKMILHVTAFAAFKLATEYMELTEPLAKVVRTAEEELEHAERILEMIVLIFPLWSVIEKTHPGYELMKEWITKNHENALVKPCVCDGCKPLNDKVN